MEAIRLSVPLSAAQQSELLKSLYWLDERVGRLWFDDQDPQTLYLTATSGAVDPELQCTIQTAADQQAQVLRMIPSKVAFASDRELPANRGDVYQELINRGWVKRSTTGVHIYSGLMATLYRALDEMFRLAGGRFQAEELIVPNLMGLGTLEQTGYFNGFPHLVNFVAHLPEKAGKVRDFNSARQADGIDSALATHQHLAPADAVCTPAVCHHFYHLLEGQTLGAADCVATAMSQCYRFEGKPLASLTRLREFSMREVMFVGSEAAIVQRRQQCLEKLRELLDACELHYSVATASDPFFLDDAHKQTMFQKSFDLKYEALATLPGESGGLAIGSVNYHQDHFGQAFRIRTCEQAVAHSCCLAFGVDRWSYAVFAQHGFDLMDWPAALREAVNEAALTTPAAVEAR